MANIRLFKVLACLCATMVATRGDLGVSNPVDEDGGIPPAITDGKPPFRIDTCDDTSRLAPANQSNPNPFEVIYKWKLIDYEWPNDTAREVALADGTYIPLFCTPSGIKCYEDFCVVTTPRLKQGVPSTVNVLPKNPKELGSSPLFKPYPNWEMQEIGNCSAFQLVQSIEINYQKGLLYVIDSGYVDKFRGPPAPICPAKLVIINLKTDEVIHSYTFPEDVAQAGTNFLNDLVVNGNYLYIADMDMTFFGVIVYDIEENKAWKVRDIGSMMAPATAGDVIVNGVNTILAAENIDGIAYCPKKEELYYNPLGSTHLFSINSSILNIEREPLEENADSGVSEYVVDHGAKQSFSDGMTFDNECNLYYGLQGCNIVAKWNLDSGDFEHNQEIFEKNDEIIQWADGFGIYKKELYIITDNLQSYVFAEQDPERYNYRMIKAPVDADNYQIPFQ